METKSKQQVARDVERTRAEAKLALQNAGEVWSGRNAIASAWRSIKGKVHRTQDRIADSAHATDETIRTHIYSTLGIAAGVGALIGFLASGRSSRKKHRA
jgi:ElaB/YqjD/DUF883 family membrane-anchored ribosome-binding protein